MTSPAISIESVSKVYTLGSARPRYGSLRDDLARAARRVVSMGRRSGGNGETPTKTLWALRDVTVQVPRGRILGVVGANGAGKSTLLKILSGITRPTSGQAVVTGRVASLLEVGTGFHPELSGAENIYLSAAILGMPRTEIRRKFDEIVDFAGVRDLIDTPVKHYSSGLYLRLGFAVAAHLDAEILLIDEVLAVGDAQFQRRSTSKMQDVVKDGRTVLFVSHNLTAVRHVCDHAIWLREGRVVEDGPADRIVDHYAKQSGADGRPGARLAEQLSRAPDDPVFSLLSVQLEQGEAETLVL